MSIQDARHPLEMLSPNARAVLEQLGRQPCRDGDLISKHGRNELIAAGLAKRETKFVDGQMRNELTQRGKYLRATAQLDTAQAYAKLWRTLEKSVRPAKGA